MHRTAIDGARRRRLYLFRHGAVDYIGSDGNWVADPDNVDLNAKGRSQAAAMSTMFADVAYSRWRAQDTSATFLGLKGFGLFDQETCCLNITADDMESLAEKLLQMSTERQ